MKKTITLLTLTLFLLLTACGSNSVTKTESKPESETTMETASETASTDICPASEYGNHDWTPATCIEPARCDDCHAYKDDKVASHHNWYNYNSGRKCMDCNLSYSDYEKSLK